MINLRDNFFAVEVPEGAKNIEILPGSPQALNYEYSKESCERCDQWSLSIEDLPPGQWQIVCTSKEATEAIADKIVENDDAWFRCYAGKRSHDSALHSLFCLMDERGCDMRKYWLILKKQ
jgi:hypothetical protein